MELHSLNDLGRALRDATRAAHGDDDVSERAGVVQTEIRRVMAVLQHLPGPALDPARQLLQSADLRLTQALVLSSGERLTLAEQEILSAAELLERP